MTPGSFLFSKTWFLSVDQASLELESSAASAFVVLGVQAHYHHGECCVSVRVHVDMEARTSLGVSVTVCFNALGQEAHTFLARLTCQNSQDPVSKLYLQAAVSILFLVFFLFF